MFKKYTIKEQECGYLMKNGKYEKLLTAGRYTYPAFLGYEVLKTTMTGEVNTCGIPRRFAERRGHFPPGWSRRSCRIPPSPCGL